MEKSQWDLKKIRFQRRRLTRLDDFVQIYQHTHNALLKEFSDSTRKRKVSLTKCLLSVQVLTCTYFVNNHYYESSLFKTYRVNVERWRERKPSKKGIYVSPIKKAFPFKTAKVVL